MVVSLVVSRCFLPPPPPLVEYLNIDDVSVARDTTSFVISPTLIPSEATVDYALIRNPTGVSISVTNHITTVSIPRNMNVGEYNITVKATGNGDYSGVTGATFKLNVVLPPADEGCFGFGTRTGTITNYTCPVVVDAVIPASIKGVAVTHIKERAFFMKNLTSVIIPDSVTSIGEDAFRSNNLTSVYIPNSVTRIGNNAFRNSNLTSVYIGDSVTYIGYGAFAKNNLTSVYIGDSVTRIEDFAFQYNHLTSVYIPDSVRSIGYGAFTKNRLASVSIKSGTDYTLFGSYRSFSPSCTVANGCITIRP